MNLLRNDYIVSHNNKKKLYTRLEERLIIDDDGETTRTGKKQGERKATFLSANLAVSAVAAENNCF